MPLSAVENVMNPADQLAPKGGRVRQSVMAAPPLTATLRSELALLLPSKNASQRPSGEKTGFNAPTPTVPSTPPPLKIRRVRLSDSVWRYRPAPLPNANADPSGDIAKTCRGRVT